MWLRNYIEDKIGVSIIDSIPHFYTENALERGKNQEMLIRFCVGGWRLEFLSSIVFHIVLLKML